MTNTPTTTTLKCGCLVRLDVSTTPEYGGMDQWVGDSFEVDGGEIATACEKHAGTSLESRAAVDQLIEKARQQVGDIADKSMREQLIADLADALEEATGVNVSQGGDRTSFGTYLSAGGGI